METFLEGIDALAGSRSAGPARGRAAARVARAWREDLLSGYREDPAAILTPLRARGAVPLVAVKGIAFTSICRHHLLPFQGLAHIAYVPSGRIAGLSRLPRLVGCLSRRLQLQESLTREIAEALQEHLAPEGAACVLEATHGCVSARGSRPRATIVTAAFTGSLLRSAARRREVLALLRDPAPGRRAGQSGRPVRTRR